MSKLALQIVNDHRFSRVVSRGVVSPVQVDRAITGIIIDPVVFV
jgi:hypothetical protein